MNVVQFGRFAGMRELALFAGAGGGILGGKMLGWRTVCAVEIEDYPRRVLLQRQRDGILDHFPIWDDVCTFDGKPWKGRIDVISGGFPCQDISSAGKGLGIEHGKRSGLWREYARIIREIRPRYCFVENSPMLTKRGIGIVLGNLAALGYDAAWKVLSAEDCGAPHQRKRMWIVAKLADADCNGSKTRTSFETSRSKRMSNKPYDSRCALNCEICDSASERLQKCVWKENTMEQSEQNEQFKRSNLRAGKDALSNSANKRNVRRNRIVETNGKTDESRCDDGRGTTSDWGREWWKTEPGLGRVADGVANRVGRIKSIGNGQVPIVAARAFCELYDQLNIAKHETYA